MRVDVAGYRSGGGFLQVRFDGTYVASPMNELRVCTGTLASAELDGWIALIERTDGFRREGRYGNMTHSEVSVGLWSEEGLRARFSVEGLHPPLDGFRDATEAFWETLDLESCAPAALDPAASISAWIDPLEWDREGGARIEVTRDGAVRALIGPWAAWSHDDEELVPCAPLADPDPFWATVLAAVPFEPRPADEPWRQHFGRVSAEVTAADGTTHRRWATYYLDSSRPEQARLEEALLALAQNHCTP